MDTQTVLQWFVQNPLGDAAVAYAVAIVGVLVYTFLEYQRES